MSKILVLNRYRLQSSAFHRWLGPEHDLFLLNCDTRPVDRHPEAAAIRSRYRAIAEFDNYVTNPEVMATAREWIEKFEIDTILASSEYDVLRAAELRESFGIEGQGLASALAFRDKLTMKRILDAAGLPLIPYTALEKTGDLARFAQDVGYPVLVKPRTGTGSKGIERIADAAAATVFDAEHRGDLADFLAEAFRAHELLHCDGILAGGQVLFSEIWSWSTTMLLAREKPLPTMAITLDAADSRRNQVSALTELTLRALPLPPTTAFHIEFLDTVDGIVVNEAASRVGGGRIQPTLRLLHGIDLVEAAARFQTGSPPESIASKRTAPNAGFLMEYDHGQQHGYAPAACPLPDISYYETTLPLANGVREDVASSAYLLSGVAVGVDSAETQDKLLAMHRWFFENIVPA
jgi:biotin carboxylase